MKYADANSKRFIKIQPFKISAKVKRKEKAFITLPSRSSLNINYT